MLRAFHVIVLIINIINSSAIFQTKEYDCPEYNLNYCNTNPIYEYRNNLECKSDYVCGIGQKCCNNCNYAYKVCTNIIIKEYLTNQDEYLKNKYCPKAKPCLTPLKYDRRYRCLSDEVCSYGYKCCKSDCYIHKVCAVPINKEGIEAVPPITTISTTTEEETTSTVIRTSTETTLFSSTTKQYTEEHGGQVTVTKPFITTSSEQTTNTPPPITTTTRRTTITQEIPTKIQETTRATTEFYGSGGGITDDNEEGDDGNEFGSGEGFETTTPSTSYTKVTTVSEKEISDNLTTITLPAKTVSSTTIRQEISTKIPTQIPEFTSYSDGVTDDNEDGDDGDDFGSGSTETDSTTPSSASHTEVSEMGGTGDNATTTGLPATTIHQVTLTEIQKTTQTSTDFTSSDDEVTDSGTGVNVETDRTATVTASYTGVTGKEANGNATTTELPTSLYPSTIHQVTSTEISKTTLNSSTDFTSFGDGITDDNEDGDDADDFGSGDDGISETQSTMSDSPSYTRVPEKEASGNATTIEWPTSFSQTTIHQITSTETPKNTQTSTDFTSLENGTTADNADGDDFGSGDGEDGETQSTVSDPPSYTAGGNATTRESLTSLSQTTIHQITLTENPKNIEISTDFTSSGDGITDDNEDGDDFGSGDGENVEIRSTVSDSPSNTKVPEKEGVKITTTMSSMSTLSTAIDQVTSTKIPEITQTKTQFTTSGDGITEDNENDNVTSGITTIRQETSTNIPETTKFIGSGYTNHEENGNASEIGSGDGPTLEAHINATDPSVESTNKVLITGNDFDFESVNETRSATLTTTRNQLVENFENITISYETLAPSTNITTDASPSVSIKPNLPTPVEFDYEDEVTTSNDKVLSPGLPNSSNTSDSNFTSTLFFEQKFLSEGSGDNGDIIEENGDDNGDGDDVDEQIRGNFNQSLP